MIGIIGAMRVEVDHLIKRMEKPAARVESGITYISGTLEGVEVVVAKCGVGKVNAAACAQTMALLYRPNLIVNTGVAGGLSPGLAVGDIVVGSDVVQHDVDTTALGDPPGLVSTINVDYFPLDSEAATHILAAARELPARACKARIASGDQFVASSDRKTEIVRLFSADACDMEAGAIAQICLMNGIRCAVVRAISDGGDEMAQMSYARFLPLAAERATKLLLAFLRGVNSV